MWMFTSARTEGRIDGIDIEADIDEFVTHLRAYVGHQRHHGFMPAIPSHYHLPTCEHLKTQI